MAMMIWVLVSSTMEHKETDPGAATTACFSRDKATPRCQFPVATRARLSRVSTLSGTSLEPHAVT